jgi:acetoacetate decarboxylase
VNSDTICGKLTYSNQLVAQGTMSYKYKEIPEKEAIKALGKTQVNLKLIPDVDWSPKVARLVSYNLTNIKFKGAWEGPARLHLIPHVNCPAAELPVRKVLGGKHFLADITLPYGNVMYDYLKERKQGTLYKGTNPNALTPEKILNSTAMPVIAPSYAKGPLGLHDREYFILRYQTDEGVLQKFLPDKLFANKDNEVIVQWITTRGTGIGDYSKFEVLIPCTDERGNVYRFGVFSFLNSSAPITEGREVWGQPQKFAHPTVGLEKDTINGSLEYSKMQVANGTMRYKQRPMDERVAIDFMTVPYLYLKLIPDVRGAPEIAQLVELNPNDVRIHSAWEGDAALHLIDHANAPVADLPVRKVIGGLNLVVDMTFGAGSVRHDYLAGRTD